MRFLYWVPNGTKPVTRETINQFGLNYALPGKIIARPTTGVGPTGQIAGGHVCCHVSGDERVDVGFYAGRQVWQQLDGSEAWIGYERSSMPKPIDLQRQRMTPLGKWIELHDGNEWYAPIGQRPVKVGEHQLPACAFPQKAVRINGEWRTDGVTNEYQSAWQLTIQVFDEFLKSSNTVSIDLDRATQALSVNYRIGPNEAGILGLWQTDGVKAAEVLQALIDLDGWRAITSGESQAA